ncbi:hypothetical protein PTKIN_Ptkin03bG0252600 [Pterospermum kingtungense]
MVGRGNSRREESVVINRTNVFAALGSLKRKKKKGSEKEQQQGSSSKSKLGDNKEAEKEVFWAPAPLKVSSWADVDDEDDDDYYATMAPPNTAWDTRKEPEPALEESESEEEGLDEVDDDDVEEEHENEAEAQVEVHPIVNKPPEASTKETERQLSKKELKKKGLEELDAVLAELGYTKEETSGPNDDSRGIAQGKTAESNGEMDKKENAAAESKSAKKKKKKDKSSKQAKESLQGQPEGTDAGNDAEETGETRKPEETPAVDVKERLKKVASSKKKKSSKEMDAAARAAANEAAARTARLAAAKKKEKNHYNQHPVR